MTGAELPPGDEVDDTDRPDRDGAELPQDGRDPTVVTLLARLESLSEHVADLDAQVADLSKEEKAAKAKVPGHKSQQ